MGAGIVHITQLVVVESIIATAFTCASLRCLFARICGVGQLIDELYVVEEIFSLKEPQLSSVVPLSLNLLRWHRCSTWPLHLSLSW